MVGIEDKVEITNRKTKLPAKIKGNTPVLPLKMCLELIEEIEKEKMTMKGKKKPQLKDVWPQLKYALSWTTKNKIEGATHLLHDNLSKTKRD